MNPAQSNTAPAAASAPVPTATAPAPQAQDNFNIEKVRVRYGFWIIFCAFILILLTIVICVRTFFSANESVAVIGTVTGLVGTVVGTWFNISANTSVLNRVLQNTPGQQDGITTPTLPVVTSVSPLAGPAGIVARITGQNFAGTTVKFGGVESPLVRVVSDTQITAMTPGVKAGPADVVVFTKAGSSAIAPAAKFTIKGLGVAKVDPGQAREGEKITVYGSGFTKTTTVNFVKDPTSAAKDASQNSTFIDETQVTVNVPNLQAPPEELPLQVHVTVSDGGATTPT
ncbi:MAG: IPT/TIG domain-containing protein, partial [Mycobacteriaceae bacterium]|nr:IPT/TIG domain-containing protein [Mycobacteriaceae bacterium]